MKAVLFAKRNFKEILRDPISYIFCAVFPLVLLAVMYFAFFSEYTYWFDLKLLTPGIAVFAGAFVMLSETLIVSKDRSSSFLIRLYTSPMKTHDFIMGYTLPALALAFAQSVLCYLFAALIAVIKGVAVPSVFYGLLAALSTIPMMVAYIAAAILLGSLFSDKSAPPVTSAIITAAGFLSAAWMPLEKGSVLETVCSILPFYPANLCARTVYSGAALTAESFWIPILKTGLYAAVLFALAVFAFRKNMTSDKK